MVGLEAGFEGVVDGEVYGLVGALAEGWKCVLVDGGRHTVEEIPAQHTSQRNTPVQRRDPFLFDNRVTRMRCIPILRHIQRITHAVILRLQPDFHHLHRRDHSHRLRDTGRKPGHERATALYGAVWAGEQRFVVFVGGEPDGHFGNDADGDGANAFVESEWGFAIHYLEACCEEAAFGRLWDGRMVLEVGWAAWGSEEGD